MATACVLNGRLYVMGGYECNQLQVLEMSEENEFNWTVKAELPAWRAFAACCVFEGRLWLMGGALADGSTASVFAYDTDNDSWAPGPALPRAVAGARATTLDGEVYFTGSDGEEWVYRNEAWVDVPSDHAGHTRAAVQSIRLG